MSTPFPELFAAAAAQSALEPLYAVLADPNVAYILLCLGFLGFFLELSAPGVTVPGVLGAVSLTLAAIGLSQLPFDWRGALLIGVAFLLLLADIFVPSLGLLTIAGLALMVAGSYVLFDASQGVEVYRPLIWGFTLLMVVMSLVIGAFAVSVLRRKPTTGREGLLGKVGTVRQTLDPDGIIFVNGELWQATAVADDTSGMKISENIPVTVLRMDGLRLFVRRATATEASDAGVVVIGDRRPPVPEPELPSVQTT